MSKAIFILQISLFIGEVELGKVNLKFSKNINSKYSLNFLVSLRQL